MERDDLPTSVGCKFAPSRIPLDKKSAFLRDITFAHYVTICTNAIDSVRQRQNSTFIFYAYGCDPAYLGKQRLKRMSY